MAFRSQAARTGIILLAALPALAQTGFRYSVRHVSPVKKLTRHALSGELVVDAAGVSFHEIHRKKSKRKPVVWTWPYNEIQQLRIANGSLTVLTYADSKWKLGTDRGYRFEGKDLEKSYTLIRAHMPDRLITAFAIDPGVGSWELRVKHLTGLNSGTEGTLRFAERRLTYSTAGKEDSRTWNFDDIENISSSGPYELTVSTYERSRGHYNSYRAFHFQLKDRLDEGRLQTVWLSLQDARQLNVLNHYRKESNQ